MVEYFPDQDQLTLLIAVRMDYLLGGPKLIFVFKGSVAVSYCDFDNVSSNPESKFVFS